MQESVKKIIKTFGLPLVFCCLFGIVYIALATKHYTSTSSAVIFRPKVESPHAVDETSKNRWVWLKDGLTLQQSVKSDANLLDAIDQIPGLQDAFRKYSAKSKDRPNVDQKIEFAKKLSKGIKLEYTGADSSTYIVHVTHKDPEIAYRLNKFLLNVLKTRVTTEVKKHYERVLESIRTQYVVSEDEERTAHLKEAYNKILVSQAVSQSEAELNYQALSLPLVPIEPSSPKIIVILLTSILSGLALGVLKLLLESNKILTNRS